MFLSRMFPTSQLENYMKKIIVSIAMISGCIGQAIAEDPPKFPQGAPIGEFVVTLPISNANSWVPGATAHRYDGEIQTDTMSRVRTRFFEWCLAQGSGQKTRILAKENSCIMAPGGEMHCPLGMWVRPNGSTDIEIGLKASSANAGGKVEFGWPKAPYLVPQSVIGSLLGNSKERTVIGDIHRCIDASKQDIFAMLFYAVDGVNHLMLIPKASLDIIIAGGTTTRAEEVASLKPGDAISSKADRTRRGMIIEIKGVLAQVQWNDIYGRAKETSWVRMTDIDLARYPTN